MSEREDQRLLELAEDLARQESLSVADALTRIRKALHDPTTADVVEDPRVQPGICGITHTGATGIEWVCINVPHDGVYLRRRTDAHHHGYVSGTGAHPERREGVQAPPADRHYFVPRWPNRPTGDAARN